MLFYRVKSSSDGKPYLVRRRGGIEYWSAIVAGELFTPNEVAKRGLSLDNLEAVDVNLRRTHFAGPYRLPNDDASITPAQSTKDVKPLSHAVEEQVAKVATARPIYMPGTKPNRKRGELKVVRS
jgi:hypothetical protein